MKRAKVTLRWLKSKSACQEGVKWFNAQTERDPIKLVEKLMAEKQNDWANWLIVRIMEQKQYLAYAIFAAEQVLDIYEKKYPTDTRPRVAIEAARKCLADDLAAAWAAWAAGDAAGDAAWAAGDAAWAAWAAWAAGDAAKEKMLFKILKYGLELLK